MNQPTTLSPNFCPVCGASRDEPCLSTLNNYSVVKATTGFHGARKWLTDEEKIIYLNNLEWQYT